MGSGVGGHLRRLDDAGHRIAEHDLFIVHAVAAQERHLLLRQDLQSSPHHLRQDGPIHTLLGKTGHRKGRHRCPGHGPDIIEGIQGGNAPVVEGIVDDRGKEVQRLDQGQIVPETKHSRVVGSVEADQKIGISGLSG